MYCRIYYRVCDTQNLTIREWCHWKKNHISPITVPSFTWHILMVILTNKWHYIVTLNKYFCQTTFQCNNSSWLIHQFVHISQLKALLVFVLSVMMNDIVNWHNIVSIKQFVVRVYQRWCRFCKNTENKSFDVK